MLVSIEKAIEWAAWVVDHTYCSWAGAAFRQSCGIPMGTNCAPDLAQLYLFVYEIQFLGRCIEAEQQHRSESAVPVKSNLSKQLLTLLLAKRFIDDIFLLRFHHSEPRLVDWLYDTRDQPGGSDGIYPSRLQGAVRVIDSPLELSVAGEGTSVPYLDFLVSIDRKSGLLVSEIYDKREANAAMIEQRSFPHRKSALSYKCKAGVIGSQLHRFKFNDRTTGMTKFVDRTEKFFRKMASHHFTPRSLFRQVQQFRNFSPSKGSWHIVLRMLKRRLSDLLPPQQGTQEAQQWKRRRAASRSSGQGAPSTPT